MDDTSIAKAMICNADFILSAIDRYIQKADDDLKDTLENNGFVNAAGTVATVNALEEQIADALEEQTDTLSDVISSSTDGNWDTVNESVNNMLSEDDIAETVAEAAEDMYTVNVPELATIYLQNTDPDLVVEEVSSQITSWITEWSAQLGELMKTTSHRQITDLIQDAIDRGISIAELSRTIQSEGFRNELWQARRVALTETLMAHSVAQEEAIQQNPAVEQKEWIHSGGHRIEPRANHVDMSGQIVDKNEPFTLKGRDGNTYYPMYPRDPLLPACESINCHCIHRGVVNKDIFRMPADYKKKMQDESVKAANKKWEENLDKKNKAAAGIKPYNAYEKFTEKTREKQIKYIGGKAKMALYDAGLVTDEKMLKKIKNSTLQELREDGILTIETPAIKHSTVGDFTNRRNPNKPAGGRNGGNMNNGGHSQANIDELMNRGISYSIEKTYDNGVRIGGVEGHKESDKRLGQTGQAWFPENWDSDKITIAGTYTANKPAIIIELKDDDNIIGYKKYQKYDGVVVGIVEDAEHNINTIFPDGEQREVNDFGG